MGTRTVSLVMRMKSKRYVMSFKALRAGTLVVNWFSLPRGAKSAGKKPTLIASGKKTFKAAGTATLTLKLTAEGAHLLQSAKRLKVTARSAFTPRGAAAISKSKTFTLTR